MSNNEVWAKCGDCGQGLKQGDKQCPKCGSTRKAYRREVSTGLNVEVTKIGAKQKRNGFQRPIKEILARRKHSGDPKSPEVVDEERTIDREKNEYHQVVKDAQTGEVIHEEHQRLSEHNTEHEEDKEL